MKKLKYESITKIIIKAFYNVYNQLGYGFLESVYEKAMIYELNRFNISVKSQVPIDVYYYDKQVGHFRADLIIEDKIIVELKSKKILIKQDEAQLLNYLNATNKEVGLLLNFGKKAEIIRKVFDNKIKKYKRKK